MNNRLMVWGFGNDFKMLLPFFSMELKKEHISILGITGNNCPDDELPFRFIPKDDIGNSFDYIVIASSRYFWDIYDEILELGRDESHIIDGRIFASKNFDFLEYQNDHRLQERVFDNCFSDNTYVNRVRKYNGKNIEIILGRKSYVASSVFDNGGANIFSKINIGHYTSVAWDVCWDLGLNLDHDYHRVSNYGMTHLNTEGNLSLEQKSTQNTITIGSDVWIGKDVKIKSGVCIGDGAVVAAHSNVVSNIPPYAIYGGNPAKLIKYRFDEKTIQAFEKIHWWEWPEEKIHEAVGIFERPNEFIRRYLK